MASSSDWAKRILVLTAEGQGDSVQGQLATFIRTLGQGNGEPYTGTKESAVVQLVRAWSMLRLGHPRQAKEALGATDFACLREADTTLTTRELSLAYAAGAEVMLLGGDVRGAHDAARRALCQAQFLETEGEKRRAQGLLAAALAVHGEIRAAHELIETSATDTLDRDSILENWPMAIAMLLVGNRNSGPAFNCKPENVDAGQPANVATSGSVVIEGYGAVEAVTRYMRRGDFEGAYTLCELYRSSLKYPDAPELFSQLLIGAEALCLLQMRQPGRVVSLLGNRKSPSDHFVCYELLVANAQLSLNNPTGALEATAPCIDMGSTHCLATRVSVLLRRAVAEEMLGRHAAADNTYLRACDLAHRGDLVMTPLGLPLAVLETLTSRLKLQKPELGARIANGIAKGSATLDIPPTVVNFGELSARELELAQHMASGKTLSTISKETFHSINTLKTQASSIYRKLGVSSRDEAVAVMSDLGFFS